MSVSGDPSVRAYRLRAACVVDVLVVDYVWLFSVVLLVLVVASCEYLLGGIAVACWDRIRRIRRG